jgi:hypothetical protein
LGVRLDNYDGWAGDATTTGAKGLAFEIGQSLESEVGFNPFGPFNLSPNSVVYSKHMYFFGGGNSANEFINGYGRAYEDQPLSMKLYGSFDLPWGLVGSFFYRHASGTPYNRTLTIAAPEAWAAANNALTWDVWVNLEPSGKRRNQSFDNLDIRFEKQFGLPFGKVGIFADIYNLLGNKYIYYGQDPSGYWQPDGSNTSSGAYTPDYYYGKINGLTGVRIYKLSVRYSF